MPLRVEHERIAAIGPRIESLSLADGIADPLLRPHSAGIRDPLRDDIAEHGRHDVVGRIVAVVDRFLGGAIDLLLQSWTRPDEPDAIPRRVRGEHDLSGGIALQNAETVQRSFDPKRRTEPVNGVARRVAGGVHQFRPNRGGVAAHQWVLSRPRPRWYLALGQLWRPIAEHRTTEDAVRADLRRGGRRQASNGVVGVCPEPAALVRDLAERQIGVIAIVSGKLSGVANGR